MRTWGMLAGQFSHRIRWISRPEIYAHRPDRVETVETHISHVFLAGSHVYK